MQKPACARAATIICGPRGPDAEHAGVAWEELLHSTLLPHSPHPVFPSGPKPSVQRVSPSVLISHWQLSEIS